LTCSTGAHLLHPLGPQSSVAGAEKRGIDGERARWLEADANKSSGWLPCARKTS
jgi:hypothetical protein